MKSAASVLAAISSTVSLSFGPDSGDQAILDEVGQVLITKSGIQVLAALKPGLSDNPVASLALQSAMKFGSHYGD